MMVAVALSPAAAAIADLGFGDSSAADSDKLVIVAEGKDGSGPLPGMELYFCDIKDGTYIASGLKTGEDGRIEISLDSSAADYSELKNKYIALEQGANPEYTFKPGFYKIGEMLPLTYTFTAQEESIDLFVIDSGGNELNLNEDVEGGFSWSYNKSTPKTGWTDGLVKADGTLLAVGGAKLKVDKLDGGDAVGIYIFMKLNTPKLGYTFAGDATLGANTYMVTESGDITANERQITVVVLDANGMPIKGAYVDYKNPDSKGKYKDTKNYWGPTDEDGEFSFAGRGDVYWRVYNGETGMHQSPVWYGYTFANDDDGNGDGWNVIPETENYASTCANESTVALYFVPHGTDAYVNIDDPLTGKFQLKMSSAKKAKAISFDETMFVDGSVRIPYTEEMQIFNVSGMKDWMGVKYTFIQPKEGKKTVPFEPKWVNDYAYCVEAEEEAHLIYGTVKDIDGKLINHDTFTITFTNGTETGNIEVTDGEYAEYFQDGFAGDASIYCANAGIQEKLSPLEVEVGPVHEDTEIDFTYGDHYTKNVTSVTFIVEDDKGVPLDTTDGKAVKEFKLTDSEGVAVERDTDDVTGSRYTFSTPGHQLRVGETYTLAITDFGGKATVLRQSEFKMSIDPGAVIYHVNIEKVALTGFAYIQLVDEAGNKTELANIPDAEFELSDKSGSIVFPPIETDENGMYNAQIPYGTYYATYLHNGKVLKGTLAVDQTNGPTDTFDKPFNRITFANQLTGRNVISGYVVADKLCYEDGAWKIDENSVKVPYASVDLKVEVISTGEVLFKTETPVVADEEGKFSVGTSISNWTGLRITVTNLSAPGFSGKPYTLGENDPVVVSSIDDKDSIPVKAAEIRFEFSAESRNDVPLYFADLELRDTYNGDLVQKAEKTILGDDLTFAVLIGRDGADPSFPGQTLFALKETANGYTFTDGLSEEMGSDFFRILIDVRDLENPTVRAGEIRNTGGDAGYDPEKLKDLKGSVEANEYAVLTWLKKVGPKFGGSMDLPMTMTIDGADYALETVSELAGIDFVQHAEALKLGDGPSLTAVALPDGCGYTVSDIGAFASKFALTGSALEPISVDQTTVEYTVLESTDTAAYRPIPDVEVTVYEVGEIEPFMKYTTGSNGKFTVIHENSSTTGVPFEGDLVYVIPEKGVGLPGKDLPGDPYEITYSGLTSVKGTVAKESGAAWTAADGAVVTLYKNGVPCASANVGADGSFKIEGIDPGEYEVVLSGGWAFILSTAVNEGKLTVTAEEKQTVTVKYNGSPKLVADASHADGVLKDKNDKPLPGTDIVLDDGRTIRTGADGKFEYEVKYIYENNPKKNADDKAYRFVVADDGILNGGGHAAFKYTHHSTGTPSTFTLVVKADVALNTYIFKVTDLGEPVQGAQIDLYRDGYYKPLSGADADLQFVKGGATDAAGELAIQCTDRAWDKLNYSVNGGVAVPAPDSVKGAGGYVYIELSSKFTGTVFDHDEKPVHGHLASGSVIAVALVDGKPTGEPVELPIAADGTYAVIGVDPGDETLTYRVELAADGYGILVGAGETFKTIAISNTPADCKMDITAVANRAEGVAELDGEPLANAEIVLWSPGSDDAVYEPEDESVTVTTGADGAFEFAPKYIRNGGSNTIVQKAWHLYSYTDEAGAPQTMWLNTDMNIVFTEMKTAEHSSIALEGPCFTVPSYTFEVVRQSLEEDGEPVPVGDVHVKLFDPANEAKPYAEFEIDGTGSHLFRFPGNIFDDSWYIQIVEYMDAPEVIGSMQIGDPDDHKKIAQYDEETKTWTFDVSRSFGFIFDVGDYRGDDAYLEYGILNGGVIAFDTYDDDGFPVRVERDVGADGLFDLRGIFIEKGDIDSVSYGPEGYAVLHFADDTDDFFDEYEIPSPWNFYLPFWAVDSLVEGRAAFCGEPLANETIEAYLVTGEGDDKVETLIDGAIATGADGRFSFRWPATFNILGEKIVFYYETPGLAKFSFDAVAGMLKPKVGEEWRISIVDKNYDLDGDENKKVLVDFGEPDGIVMIGGEESGISATLTFQKLKGTDLVDEKVAVSVRNGEFCMPTADAGEKWVPVAIDDDDYVVIGDAKSVGERWEVSIASSTVSGRVVSFETGEPFDSALTLQLFVWDYGLKKVAAVETDGGLFSVRLNQAQFEEFLDGGLSIGIQSKVYSFVDLDDDGDFDLLPMVSAEPEPDPAKLPGAFSIGDLKIVGEKVLTLTSGGAPLANAPVAFIVDESCGIGELEYAMKYVDFAMTDADGRVAVPLRSTVYVPGYAFCFVQWCKLCIDAVDSLGAGFPSELELVPVALKGQVLDFSDRTPMPGVEFQYRYVAFVDGEKKVVTEDVVTDASGDYVLGWNGLLAQILSDGEELMFDAGSKFRAVPWICELIGDFDDGFMYGDLDIKDRLAVGDMYVGGGTEMTVEFRTADGEPIEGAQVGIGYTYDSSVIDDVEFQLTKSGVTGADGRFSYRISADCGLDADAATVSGTPYTIDEVALDTDDDTLIVVKANEYRYHIEVVDKDGGAVAGVGAKYSTRLWGATVPFEVAGTEAVIEAVPADEIHIAISADGCTFGSAPATDLGADSRWIVSAGSDDVDVTFVCFPEPTKLIRVYQRVDVDDSLASIEEGVPVTAGTVEWEVRGADGRIVRTGSSSIGADGCAAVPEAVDRVHFSIEGYEVRGYYCLSGVEDGKVNGYPVVADSAAGWYDYEEVEEFGAWKEDDAPATFKVKFSLEGGPFVTSDGAPILDDDDAYLFEEGARFGFVVASDGQFNKLKLVTDVDSKEGLTISDNCIPYAYTEYSFERWCVNGEDSGNLQQIVVGYKDAESDGSGVPIVYVSATFSTTATVLADGAGYEPVADGGSDSAIDSNVMIVGIAAIIVALIAVIFAAFRRN